MSDLNPLPEFVTFTGVDEQTDFGQLLELSRHYGDRVEWAVLVAPEHCFRDKPRFPRQRIVEQLAVCDVRKAVHLCGILAHDLRREGCWGSSSFLRLNRFDRVQVNLGTSRPSHIARVAKGLRKLHVPRGILQCSGAFPESTEVDWLFDQSGGSGLTPASWPACQGDRLVGFAGGFDPDSVERLVERRFLNAQRYWIDMETGVRSEQEGVECFDLDRCARILATLYGD